MSMGHDGLVALQDRLRLGKIKINFVFRSACTIFAVQKETIINNKT